MTKAQRAEQAEALDQLRELLKPGDTVRTILRHVSRSGMSRSISLVMVEDGKVRDISWLCARADLGKLDRKNDGVKVGGCGMDMGFHLVYTLSRMLFQGRFPCAGKNCPSNDHNNPPYPKRRKGTPRQHSDGGYALSHRWL